MRSHGTLMLPAPAFSATAASSAAPLVFRGGSPTSQFVVGGPSGIETRVGLLSGALGSSQQSPRPHHRTASSDSSELSALQQRAHVRGPSFSLAASGNAEQGGSESSAAPAAPATLQVEATVETPTAVADVHELLSPGSTPQYPRRRHLAVSWAQYYQLYKGETCRYMLRPPRVLCTLSGPSTPGGSQPLGAVRQLLSLNAGAGGETAGSGEESPLPAPGCCAICLDGLEAGELVQPMICCRHLFHQTCVRALVEARRGDDSPLLLGPRPLGDRILCPLCRGQLAATSLSEVPEAERDAVVWLDTTRPPYTEDGVLRDSFGGTLDF